MTVYKRNKTSLIIKAMKTQQMPMSLFLRLGMVAILFFCFVANATTPPEVADLLSKARESAAEGDFTASNRHYEDALRAGADSLPCLQAMADNAMAAKDYETVLVLCPMIRSLDDWKPYTYNYQAQANAAKGNIDSAVEDVVTLVDLVGIDNDSYEAMTAVADKDLNKMADGFRQCRSNDVNNPVWSQCLGTIFTYARLYDKACDAYLDALRLDPQSDEDMESLALLYNQMRQYEYALRYSLMAMETNPDNPSYVCNHAIILRNAGRDNEGIAQLTKAMRDTTSYAPLYTYRGLLQASNGKYEAALGDYNAALKIEPQDAPTLLRKGIALTKLGRRKEARKVFEEVVKLDYTHWSGTALAQAYLGNRKAVDEYIKYATAQKQRVDNYFSLAAMSDVLNRPQEALHFLSLALKENALNPDIIQYDQSLVSVKKLPAYKTLMATYGH